ncbi:DUF6059 family protein [Streptomyces venezuelae]|uniref:Uncharacterized protein n=1 Tax=Streptomyces venezuelae TaxID=54571 RepID=A0A5P2B3V8_STRVZ|nr:DUF6059 family protein [Streptomyces venezuelae]QES25094.1 hypothetical protein DEJ47_00200 [Streptomyces venezuelae]
MAGLIRRVWREVYAALQAYGAIYVSPAQPAEETVRPAGETARPAPGPRHGGPPAGHPERLCPEVALTPVERALNRQLETGS